MPTIVRHTLHLQPIWYDTISRRSKKWEGRLNTSAVSAIKPGDVLAFESEDRPPLQAIVVSRLHFPYFEKMLEGQGLQRLLPGVGSVEEGVEIYRGFPGYREGETEFGAVAFELRSEASGRED